MLTARMDPLRYVHVAGTRAQLVLQIADLAVDRRLC